MTRSIHKGPFSEILLKKNHNRKLWSRRSIILPENIGEQFYIHNGKNFVPLRISEEMVGHKFGEFALTRKKPIHKTSKKKGRGGK
jgi:small subunit ribosomal protein S19